MVRQRITTLVAMLFLSMAAENIWAAKLSSFCFSAEGSKDVLGQKVDEKMPLASVSKVFTTLLTSTQHSLNRKIYTQFFYNEIGKGLYDVHIKGGNEPYFGRQAFQWLVAKLNEAGVKKINRLTFDENFKLLAETDKKFVVGGKRINPVSGKDDLDMPSQIIVKKQLERPAELLKNYDKTKKEAKENGVTLPERLFFSVLKVEPILAKDEKISTKYFKGFVSSPDLMTMLKLMNWNSNNHAANRFYQYSGGNQAMEKLLYGQLGLTTAEATFINGSGQNADLDGEGRLYNEASCRSVLKVVKALKQSVEAQKLKLEDVLAVVGGDIGSTVSGKTYNNKTTNLSVIAKTGTVGTNVTLAGMASTVSGNQFFFFNVEVKAPPARVRNKEAYMNLEAQRARRIISTKLNQMITSFGGPKPIQYKTKHFDLDNFEDSDDGAEIPDIPEQE